LAPTGRSPWAWGHRNSYVSVFARRKEQIEQIDRLLALYHAEGPWTTRSAIEKTHYLREMLAQVHDHMREKPTSDRATAFIILGTQIVATIKTTAQRYAWKGADFSWLPQE
jgi:hypothetical protein